MNFHDWYTDTVDIWRVVPVQDESLTRHERRELYRNIPCRLYQVEAPEIRMSQAAASADQKDWLQCDNEVDIQAGDELIIHRGAVLGKSIPDIRAFASGPNHFFEPFGAIMPGLAHQEIRLLQQERVELRLSRPLEPEIPIVIHVVVDQIPRAEGHAVVSGGVGDGNALRLLRRGGQGPLPLRAVRLSQPPERHRRAAQYLLSHPVDSRTLYTGGGPNLC